MKREVAKGLFDIAGIPVLRIRPLPDGYSYSPDDPRYYETPPRCVWWFVKTPVGWVEIGWRKRVVSINWEDTTIRKIITNDDVTKSDTFVHAWGEAKAIEYLKALGDAIDAAAQKEAQSPDVDASDLEYNDPDVEGQIEAIDALDDFAAGEGVGR